MSRRLGNAWLSVTQEIVDEYLLRTQQAEDYTGPMDDETYRIFSETMSDSTVMNQYATVESDGKTLRLFSMYQEGEQQLKRDVDYLVATWPDEIVAQGCWWVDTGEQCGPLGAPLYPIRDNLWMFMPPQYTYDAAGKEIETRPNSNADLRDVNRLNGQAPRDFTQLL